MSGFAHLFLDRIVKLEQNKIESQPVLSYSIKEERLEIIQDGLANGRLLRFLCITKNCRWQAFAFTGM